MGQRWRDESVSLHELSGVCRGFERFRKIVVGDTGAVDQSEGLIHGPLNCLFEVQQGVFNGD